jgi:hypothetical protein
MEIERAYGVATTIVFPLITAGDDSYLAGATIAAGDAKVMKDEGAWTTTGSAFADVSEGYYSQALTATEMQADRVVVKIVDQTGTKEWIDQSVVINTHRLTDPTGVPAWASMSRLTGFAWLTALSRNLITNDGASTVLKADDGTTTVATSTTADVAGTFTAAEWT